MTLFEELQPLILGPFVRAIAFYIEIVTFSMTLLARGGILDVVSFAVLGVIGITDIVLCVRTRKTQKVARYLEQDVKHRPKVGIIVYDIIAGVLALISWGCYMWYGSRRYRSYYYGNYSVFGAYVVIGDLAIAHVHIFMGSIAAHTLRQQKNGQKAARRAHSREQSKHGADDVVELAEPVEGSSRLP